MQSLQHFMITTITGVVSNIPVITLAVLRLYFLSFGLLFNLGVLLHLLILGDVDAYISNLRNYCPFQESIEIEHARMDHRLGLTHASPHGVLQVWTVVRICI